MLRLNPNGSADATFNPEVLGWSVDRLAVQPDGKLLVGGSFSSVRDSVGEVACTNLVRLNPDGDIDRGFVNGAPYIMPSAITLQRDGRILVGGGPTGTWEAPYYVLARLNPDGSLDTAFARGTIESEFGGGRWIKEIALQDDGQVLVGGHFSAYHDGFAPGLVRLNGGEIASTCRLSAALCPRTGLPQFMLTGPAEATVVIEATSDLQTWTPLMTVTNTLSGVQVCDPAANGSPQRFYRARLLEQRPTPRLPGARIVIPAVQEH